MKSSLRSTLTLTCLLGCSIAPLPVVPPDPATAPALTLSEFPGATIGFDDRSDDPSWQGNDEVLFALRLRKGDEVHRWLLRLEVMLGERLVARIDNDNEHDIELWGTQTWTWTSTREGVTRHLTATSKMLPILVTVGDEHGTELDRSVVRLPANLLGRGVLPAVELALHEEATTEPVDDDALRPMVEAMIAMMALLNVVQQDDALAEYFWQVVERPSVWSVVTSLGVRATLSMPFEQSLPATRLPAELPAADSAYVVPLRIDVNGSPALLADVVATDARRPYALCGGMVAAIARHPSNPHITFELQLLSARLGKPGSPTRPPEPR